MNSFVELLDVSDGLEKSSAKLWSMQMLDSLSRLGPEWLEVAQRATVMNEDRAWTLLSWVELAANVVSRERDGDYLEIAAFAISLLESGDLDRRDRAVVAALLRRAAVAANLDFVTSVTAGCHRAGELGSSCLSWLVNVSDETPETHEEVWIDGILTFVRKRSKFDVSDLANWLENDGLE